MNEPQFWEATLLPASTIRGAKWHFPSAKGIIPTKAPWLWNLNFEALSYGSGCDPICMVLIGLSGPQFSHLKTDGSLMSFELYHSMTLYCCSTGTAPALI